MKDKLFPMRNEESIQGLIDLIEHVNMFHNTKDLLIVEIGSYAGDSTEIFSQNFKNVISVDPFIDDYDLNDPACSYLDLTKVYDMFLEKLSRMTNVVHIRKTSDEAVVDLKDTKIDIVYIDGLHTAEQVKKDIENYMPLISKDGFICGHDYHENWQGVIDSVNELLGGPDKVFADSSWIKKL
jgi:predicted O-methyltransferase YrrM